jgi:hypothetical protein
MGRSIARFQVIFSYAALGVLAPTTLNAQTNRIDMTRYEPLYVENEKSLADGAGRLTDFHCGDFVVSTKTLTRPPAFALSVKVGVRGDIVYDRHAIVFFPGVACIDGRVLLLRAAGPGDDWRAHLFWNESRLSVSYDGVEIQSDRLRMHENYKQWVPDGVRDLFDFYAEGR